MKKQSNMANHEDQDTSQQLSRKERTQWFKKKYLGNYHPYASANSENL